MMGNQNLGPERERRVGEKAEEEGGEVSGRKKRGTECRRVASCFSNTGDMKRERENR
jgi:hypothetical protein